MATNKDVERELREMGIEMGGDEVVDVTSAANGLSVDNIDVVYQERDSTAKKAFKVTFMLIPLALAVATVILVAAVVSQFRLVPANVVGASFEIGEYSLISRGYELSTRNITVGTVVFYTPEAWTDRSFVASGVVGTVKTIKEQMYYIEPTGESETVRVPMSSLMYIVDTQ